MPVTKSDISNFIVPVLRQEFWEGYQESISGDSQKMLDTLVTTITIEGDTARFPFLGDMPRFQRWIDERKQRTVKNNSYSLQITDPWEDTVTFKRTAMSADMTGQLRLRARDMGKAVVQNRLHEAINALISGTATTNYGACYDGQAFFYDSHATVAVDLTAGTGDNNTTGALTAANLKTWIQTMQLFTSDQGNPLGCLPTHILVGPQNRWAAQELTMSPIQVLAGASSDYTNVLQHIVTPLVSEWITGTQVYLLDLSKAVKPIIQVQQSTVPVEFQALEEGSEHAFWKDEFAYGARDVFETGYGLWQTALYSTGS